MTLAELIQKLKEIEQQHGSDIEVSFTIPAHEGSYEDDYGASELTDSDVGDLTWKGVKNKHLFLTFE
tara:strand:- start:131 stop:331 length:201 start_codon:yes stop_codon:yes gene_type:complete